MGDGPIADRSRRRRLPWRDLFLAEPSRDCAESEDRVAPDVLRVNVHCRREELARRCDPNHFAASEGSVAEDTENLALYRAS